MVAGKEGSAMNMLLADAAVAISVALQFGVPPHALAKSVGRVPLGLVSPSDLSAASVGVGEILLLGIAAHVVEG